MRIIVGLVIFSLVLFAAASPQDSDLFSAARADDLARAAAAPVRISLVAITVPDLETAAEWYRRYLGFERVSEVMKGPGAEMVLLRTGGATLELLRRDGSASPASLLPGYDNPALLQGYGKVAYEVDGLDALAGRMKADGVRFVFEPRAATTAAFAGYRTCIVVDNAGNWVQLLEKTKSSR